MATYNATQYISTNDQGVQDLAPEMRVRLTSLLTFSSIPTVEEIHSRAGAVTELLRDSGAMRGDQAMIGGAPFFMAALERALLKAGITPVYAFSVRMSVEETQADGSIKKVAVFRHGGFVPCATPTPETVIALAESGEFGTAPGARTADDPWIYGHGYHSAVQDVVKMLY